MNFLHAKKDSEIDLFDSGFFSQEWGNDLKSYGKVNYVDFDKKNYQYTENDKMLVYTDTTTGLKHENFDFLNPLQLVRKFSPFK